MSGLVFVERMARVWSLKKIVSTVGVSSSSIPSGTTCRRSKRLAGFEAAPLPLLGGGWLRVDMELVRHFHVYPCATNMFKSREPPIAAPTATKVSVSKQCSGFAVSSGSPQLFDARLGRTRSVARCYLLHAVQSSDRAPQKSAQSRLRACRRIASQNT